MGYDFDPSEYLGFSSQHAPTGFSEASWMRIASTVFMGVLTLLGLFSLIRNIPQSTLRKKSTKFILLWLTLLILLAFVYTLFLPGDTLEAYPLLCIPAAVYLGFLFSKKEKKKLRTGLFYAWLLVSIAFIVFAN
jgi:hypothetical protein